MACLATEISHVFGLEGKRVLYLSRNLESIVGLLYTFKCLLCSDDSEEKCQIFVVGNSIWCLLLPHCPSAGITH